MSNSNLPTEKQVFEQCYKFTNNTTKKLAEHFKITTAQAYAIANRLSQGDGSILYGEISKDGMSRGRGASRKGLSNTLSMSWWMNYGHPDDFENMEAYCKEFDIKFDESGKLIRENN